MNHARRHRALLAVASASAVVAAGLLVPITSAGAAPARPSTAVGAPATVSAAARVASDWRARPEQYPGIVKTTDIPIRMDDGVVLRGDLIQPANAQGEPVDRRLPVIVMITAYNKTVVTGGGGGLAGPGPSYLVKRGYHYLIVDARGTGSSGGTWGAFSARENKDAGKIVGWAHRQA